jgi:hypothetical protein
MGSERSVSVSVSASVSKELRLEFYPAVRNGAKLS